MGTFFFSGSGVLVLMSLISGSAHAGTIVGVVEKDIPGQEQVARVWVRPLFQRENASKNWKPVGSEIKDRGLRVEWSVLDSNGGSLGKGVKTSASPQFSSVHLIHNMDSLPQEFVSPLMAISGRILSLASKTFRLSEKDAEEIVKYGQANVTAWGIKYCSKKKPLLKDFKTVRALEFFSGEKFVELENGAETFCRGSVKVPARLSFFLWAKGKNTAVNLTGVGVTFLGGGDFDGDETSAEVLLFDPFDGNSYKLYSRNGSLTHPRVP